MDAPKSTLVRGKKDGDGLSKHQRYYKKYVCTRYSDVLGLLTSSSHPEVREKNRERERRRREEKRAAMEAAIAAASLDESSLVKPLRKRKRAVKDATAPAAVSGGLADQPAGVATKKRKRAP
ncbi:hypothetical protein DXG01_011529, partial [Tephrocybe rancida]